ncbi:uncharacterized protein LOC115729388 isoform X2 [Rhodamnia argentea]|uniref:Uncharacterized protein LOC115729388 isoform X2 n=1 Tax=Rhodamnia argentea TaxID=178133 RepID=A0A8B8N145_9MYRT|nr:uncharacterized protein LOC115729388 isoform X2 [Rhodamnia argentea]
MATQPSQQHGNSNHAEPPADVQVPTEKTYDVHATVGSTRSQSRDAPEISEIVVGGVYYRPLLQATFRGDWESAKRFFERDPASKTARITSRSETVLHVAALSARDQFFENLVELLSSYPGALEMVDCDGRTALHNAVQCGRIKMVKALVRRDPGLTQLPDCRQRFPFEISTHEASTHKEIAWFLAKITIEHGPRPFCRDYAINLILDLTYAGHHDITLYLVGKCPHLLTQKRRNLSVLGVLARMQSHFLSVTRLGVLEALIFKCIPVDLNYEPTYENSRNMQTSVDSVLQCLASLLWNAAKILVPPIKRIHEVKLKHGAAVELAKQVCIAISYMKPTEITEFFLERNLLGIATTKGNSELVKICIQFFPELIRISPNGESLMTLAVKSRKERIISLFLKVSSTNELSLVPAPTREEAERMMLAAAKFDSDFDAVTYVSGAAFQMQRELQWFKAVERWLFPDFGTFKYEGKAYWQIFTEEHKELLEKGEKWVKHTGDKCMLVSTLVATVLFAAAFTVPGGNNNAGFPLLLGQDSLLIFAISDALGLFSSVTSILLFLAILTSRYDPEDFLDSLPQKIIMGLVSLFLSLAFMLVAFTATLTIVLEKRLEWVFIPITLLASIPVFLFAQLQLPLLFQMVKSTYGPSIFRAEDIWE